MRGRFAPSPTGRLHLGNLRTALLSFVHAAAGGGSWIVRMEDLDLVTSSPVHEAGQLRDLAVLGMVPSEEVVRQSERFDRYHAAIERLRQMDRVYECFCTRREIREASAAPHGDHPADAYPGTCRHLTTAEREQARSEGRRPALRLRAHGERFTVDDLIAGHFEGPADDIVLRRSDGVPAYHVAVVVDDAAQEVSHVVRGDDLLPSVPRQRLLQTLLGLPEPQYAHVPLVIGPDGQRLAKRHGAVTLPDLAAAGIGAGEVLTMLGASLGLADPTEATPLDVLVQRFAERGFAAVPRRRVTIGA